MDSSNTSSLDEMLVNLSLMVNGIFFCIVLGGGGSVGGHRTVYY